MAARVGQAGAMDWLLSGLAIAVLAAMAWGAYHLEPHWASKDGTRCLCSGQMLSSRGEPDGRWRETRVFIGQHGHVQVDQKRFMRRASSAWTLTAESPSPPKRRVLFLLSSEGGDGPPQMLALKLPTNSRAVPVLREALQQRTDASRQAGPAT